MTFYVSTGLLALFGVKMLYEGWGMSYDEGQEELEEVSEELRKREEVVGVTYSYNIRVGSSIRTSEIL